jgi:hypothetical protein
MSHDISVTERIAELEAKLAVAKEDAIRATQASVIADERAREADKRACQAEERANYAELSPERAIIKRDLKKLRDTAAAKGAELYYKPQEDVARHIVSNINNQHIVLTLVLAPCQAGKTGCITATIDALLISKSKIDMNNIFVISGLSDNEWRQQTQSRLPISDKNIFHRGQLKAMKDKLNNLKNAVIFIDECQIATKSDQTMADIFHQCNLKDVEYLKENNINVVELSATPNRTLDDLELWNGFSNKIIMKTDEKYNGHKHMLDNNMVFEAEDLYIDDDPISELECETVDQYNARKERIKKIQPAIDSIKNLKTTIEEKFIKEDGSVDPKYHIIRTPNAQKGKDKTVENRFKYLFGSSNYEFINCNSNDMNLLERINKDTPPSKHTIIFIKESARCAVTFTKKHYIGIVYERFTIKKNDDNTAQGLAARVGCGYDVNDNCIIYANIRGIQAYVKMIESEFVERSDFKYPDMKSKTINHPSTFSNSEGESISVVETLKHTDKDHKVFHTKEEVKEFYKKLEPRVKKCLNVIAPKDLRVNDQNPTVDYLLKRWWGISEKNPSRCVATNDGKWCVYWRPSLCGGYRATK